jgi:hypothetical protein
MKNPKITKTFFATLLLLATTATFAQTFDDDVIDNTQATPIDNYIILALILALIFAFYKMKRIGKEREFFYKNKGL